MKIAIISDIHDNLTNLGKCLDWCRANAISRLICCGDVTNGETLEFLSQKFPGQIYLIKGNMEIYSEEEAVKYKNIIYFGEIGILNMGKKVIGVCHKPETIEKIKEKSECDIIFYGHTHKPWISEEGGQKLVNPGTLGGIFTKATFAVWDSENDNLELKILELL